MDIATQIRDEVCRVLAARSAHVSRSVLEAAASQAYRSGAINPAQVQQMLVLRSRWETESFPRRVTGFHDALWARAGAAGTSDTALLDLAEFETRIVLTLDKDFRMIAVQSQSPLAQSWAVLFRVHPATPERLAPIMRAFTAADAARAAQISIIHGRWHRDALGAQKLTRLTAVAFSSQQTGSSPRRRRCHARTPLQSVSWRERAG